MVNIPTKSLIIPGVGTLKQTSPEQEEHCKGHVPPLEYFGFAPGSNMLKCEACGVKFFGGEATGVCYDCAHSQAHIIHNANDTLASLKALLDGLPKHLNGPLETMTTARRRALIVLNRSFGAH